MSSKPVEMKNPDEVAQYREQQQQQLLHPPLQQPQPQVQQPKRTLKPKRKLKPRSKPKRLTLKAKSRHKKKLPGHTGSYAPRGHTASYAPRGAQPQRQHATGLAQVKEQMRDPDDAQVGYDDILYDGHVGYEDIFNPNYKMLNLNEHLPYQSNTYEIDPIYALSSAMLTIILCSITVCCLLLCLLAGVSIGFNIRKMKINKQYIQSDSVDNNNEV
eukprot:362664_1